MRRGQHHQAQQEAVPEQQTEEAEFLDEQVGLRLGVDVVAFEEFVALAAEAGDGAGGSEPEAERLRPDVLGDLRRSPIL